MWLLGFFVLRNGWFSLFEMGRRGATPGKRLMGLRVVARDGARLTGGAVIARNAMREIEVFLPLSFLVAAGAEGTADTFLVLFALMWSGIFLFFPLFNRDRLRVGDLVAGTWVVRAGRSKLGADLVARRRRPRRTFPRRRSTSTELRAADSRGRAAQRHPKLIATVARMIRDKAGIRTTATITASSPIISRALRAARSRAHGRPQARSKFSA